MRAASTSSTSTPIERATSVAWSRSWGRNSCSGGSSRRIGHGQAVHRAEDAGEVVALDGQELLEGRAPARLVLGEDHLAHRRDPLVAEEHVLGAAQADALGAERRAAVARRRACRRWRARRAAALVGPPDERREVLARVGRDGRARGRASPRPCRRRGRARPPREGRGRAGAELAPVARRSDELARHPTTQHLPMPRATTAACEVMPPVAVRMPAAACMPPMSSGLVSARTRITC